MEKWVKAVIAVSLLILAINSFFIVGYLKNITELIAGLLNVV